MRQDVRLRGDTPLELIPGTHHRHPLPLRAQAARSHDGQPRSRSPELDSGVQEDFLQAQRLRHHPVPPGDERLHRRRQRKHGALPLRTQAHHSRRSQGRILRHFRQPVPQGRSAVHRPGHRQRAQSRSGQHRLQACGHEATGRILGTRHTRQLRHHRLRLCRTPLRQAHSIRRGVHGRQVQRLPGQTQATRRLRIRSADQRIRGVRVGIPAADGHSPGQCRKRQAVLPQP